MAAATRSASVARPPPAAPRPTARGHGGRDALRVCGAAAQREEGRARTREAAAQRPTVEGGTLDRGQSGNERCAARFGDRVLERAGNLREIAAMQSIDE